MTLGENIVRLRTQKNWSQGDLADALGASHRDPDRLLVVMKDPHVGSFGVIALILQCAAKLVLLVYFAIAFFAFMVLGLVARLFGFSVIKIMRIMKDELILAYSTSS